MFGLVCATASASNHTSSPHTTSNPSLWGRFFNAAKFPPQISEPTYRHRLTPAIPHAGCLRPRTSARAKKEGVLATPPHLPQTRPRGREVIIRQPNQQSSNLFLFCSAIVGFASAHFFMAGLLSRYFDQQFLVASALAAACSSGDLTAPKPEGAG